jgi:GTPase SAR1 family protein
MAGPGEHKKGEPLFLFGKEEGKEKSKVSWSLSQITSDLSEYLDGDIKLVVIGNTNVGKSTFLNYLLGVDNFLNISEIRETSCLWIIKSHDDNN